MSEEFNDDMSNVDDSFNDSSSEIESDFEDSVSDAHAAANEIDEQQTDEMESNTQDAQEKADAEANEIDEQQTDEMESNTQDAQEKADAKANEIDEQDETNFENLSYEELVEKYKDNRTHDLALGDQYARYDKQIAEISGNKAYYSSEKEWNNYIDEKISAQNDVSSRRSQIQSEMRKLEKEMVNRKK